MWLAPDMEALQKIFSDMDVSWESMYEVEETKPDLWGEKKWKEHLEAEATADTLGDYSQPGMERHALTFSQSRVVGDLPK